MTREFDEVRMQRRLTAGEQQIPDALTIHDVHGIEGALPVHELPVRFRQAVAREVAEPAVRVAGVVDRELAKSGSSLVEHESQGIKPRFTLRAGRSALLLHAIDRMELRTCHVEPARCELFEVVILSPGSPPTI